MCYPTINGIRNKLRTASGFERRNRSARKRGQRPVVKGRRVPKWYVLTWTESANVEEGHPCLILQREVNCFEL